MKLHIEVTKEDISEACRGSASGCMIHRAFMRATEGAYWPSAILVGGMGMEHGSIVFDPADGKDAPAWTVYLPHDVTRKARLWDRGRNPAPFAFDVEVPVA